MDSCSGLPKAIHAIRQDFLHRILVCEVGGVINPRDKELDPDDPMELVGIEIPGGDVERVLDDLVQEYLFLGWSPAQIMFLFRSPHYAATHHIYEQMGADHVKGRIGQLSQQWNQGWINGGAGNA